MLVIMVVKRLHQMYPNRFYPSLPCAHDFSLLLYLSLPVPVRRSIPFLYFNCAALRNAIRRHSQSQSSLGVPSSHHIHIAMNDIVKVIFSSIDKDIISSLSCILRLEKNIAKSAFVRANQEKMSILFFMSFDMKR